MSQTVYHLVSATDWAEAEAAGEYHSPSLDTEGFIHLSAADQVAGTSLRYYRNVSDLLLVVVAMDELTAEVRWEDLVGTGTFPHLYGALPLAAVTSVAPYTPGDPVADRASGRPWPDTAGNPSGSSGAEIVRRRSGHNRPSR